MSGQPEALCLADEYEHVSFVEKHRFAREEWCRDAARELCRLHAENASLTAGYDAARLEIKSLQAELVKESARTAAEKLRADQMTAQHRMQCEMGKADRAKVQELEALLAAVGAGGVEPLRKSPVTGVEFSQFLSDVMTAAGLAEHGKQCKALATRLGDTVMRLRVEPPPKADHFRDATKMVPSDHLRGATKMTLDEAIEHADEVAGCGAQCGVEHAQLAAWLRELRDRRVTAASSQPPVEEQGDAEDAERYRWIAMHCRSTSEHWGGRWSIVVDGPAPKSHDSGDDFDAAIDAARAQDKEVSSHD